MEVIGKHDGLRESEKKVLKWLEEGLHKAKCHIFVELGRRGHYMRYRRWPDFVILSETHGVIILECKGHFSESIKDVSHAGVATTTNGFDRFDTQLRDYGCIFSKMLEGSGIPFYKFVIFPEILSTSTAAEYIHDVNSHEGDLGTLFNEDLDITFSFDHLSIPALSTKLSESNYKEVRKLINPNRVVNQSFQRDLGNRQQEIDLLDLQQITLVEEIKQGHYLINGLPGTGKTLVLTKIAERELEKGKSVMMTCYNEPLAAELQKTFNKNIARSLYSLYGHQAYKLRRSISESGNYQETMEFLLENLPAPQYDVLLIDEYQDLEDEDYTILLALLKPGGLLVLAGDRLQNVRGKKESWRSKGINLTGGRHRSKFLVRPYRTDPCIVDFALDFISTNKDLRAEAKRYFLENEFDHEHGSYDNFSERVNFLQNTRQGFIEDVKAIALANPESNILVVTLPDDKWSVSHLETGKLKVETCLRSKGLEADIVILYNLDRYKKYEGKHMKMTEEQKMRAIFSGLCRARGAVFIHGFEGIDYFYELKNIFNEKIKKIA